MHILGPTPITPCYVWEAFMHDMDQSKKGWVAGYIFAFRAVPARVPAFQVMLENGAQWANVPIHMLSTNPDGVPLKPEFATWWDCFSDTFEVVELPLLKSLACTVRNRDDGYWGGNYLFTIDWQGAWAEIPEQHKQHHVIELKSGKLVAYPNNKVLWQDPSYHKPDPELRYKRNTHFWNVEGGHSK